MPHTATFAMVRIQIMRGFVLAQAGKAGVEVLTVGFSKGEKPLEGVQGKLGLRVASGEPLQPDDMLLLRQQVYSALAQYPGTGVKSRL